MNGCSRAGSGHAHRAVRVVLDRDEVSARSRRGERHRRDVGVLRDRRAHTVTVGVKHIAPTGKGEEVGETEPRVERGRADAPGHDSGGRGIRVAGT